MAANNTYTILVFNERTKSRTFLSFFTNKKLAQSAKRDLERRYPNCRFSLANVQ